MLDVLLDAVVPPDTADRLGAIPGVRVTAVEPAADPRPLPEELLATAKVLLCKSPPPNFDAARSVELVHIGSAGYEHLKPLDLPGRGVRLCNARGATDPGIGEWVAAMLVNLTRDVAGMARSQLRARWERLPRHQQEVRGRVLGCWGYGGIGRESARIAKMFGMGVHVLTRHGVGPRSHAWTPPGTGDPDGTLPDRVFTDPADRTAFLASVDYLVLAVPRTRVTEGLVGEAELRSLRPTAFLLNPARGPLVREDALLRALREGWIAGAALDTHFQYPLPADHPLWVLPNVMLTPHVAGSERSQNFPVRLAELFVENVTRFAAGRPLLNEVTVGELREL
jgi:phosphoglycerate dehydrogenase-like enzyme